MATRAVKNKEPVREWYLRGLTDEKVLPKPVLCLEHPESYRRREKKEIHVDMREIAGSSLLPDSFPDVILKVR
jgi:hypothetical protein